VEDSSVQIKLYNLTLDELAALLKQVRDGDDRHATDPYAFPAADRAQVDADVVAWDAGLVRVNLLKARRDEARQTRDEAAKAFRDAVRPAREWAKGEFPGDDERSGEYGLETMPPRSLDGTVTYGRTLLLANTQLPPLQPSLPERLLTPIQAAFAAFEIAIAAYQAAAAAHKQAVAARRALRKEILVRLRGLRQYLYSFVGKDDSTLIDYGFAV
jgi:hypothetical protein